MVYRNGNYAAFYVREPFADCNLGPFSAPDFCYYQIMRAWKGKDRSFPFVDSHEKTYNVRDGSDWESTLKPRLRERLRKSKNMILFLSDDTIESKALKEEIEYGIGCCGLPVIVVYPGINPITFGGGLSDKAIRRWGRVPSFEGNMHQIPTLHIPMDKEALRQALSNPNYMVQTKINPGKYRL